KFHRDLTAGAAPTIEVDFRIRRAQTIAGAKDLRKGRHFEGKMVQLSIGILSVARPNQSEAMMVGVAAQKHHASGHHVLGIYIGNFETEHLRVEFRGKFEVRYSKHDMADLADVKFHSLRRSHVL